MNLKYPLITAITSIVILVSCSKKETVATGADGQFYLDLADTTTIYYPNASIATNKKAILGRVLFYDTRLSVNNAVACASCHKQQLAFADNVAFSRGFENKLTARNSMPIENLSDDMLTVPTNSFQGSLFFWDGREKDLKNLINRPVTNHVEMGISDLDALAAKLSAIDAYKSLFNQAYGTEQATPETISDAVRYFIASIRSNNSRFDQYQAGKTELTAQELQGLNLFNSKYNCNSCHNIFPGPYSGFELVNIGLDAESQDPGAFAINGDKNYKGSFRTPNLRNIALTAPYMHDGRFKTIGEVLEHYSHNIQGSPNLDVRLKDANTNKPRKMNISDQEKQALTAFLNSLTDYSMITDPKYATPFKTK